MFQGDNMNNKNDFWSLSQIFSTPNLAKHALVIAMLVIHNPSFGFEQMDDESLSEIQAQDGLTVKITPPVKLDASNVVLTFDKGVTSVNSDGGSPYAISPQASLQLDGVGWQGVNADGSLTSAPFSTTYTLDLGGRSAASATGIKISATADDRQRFQINNIRAGSSLTSGGVLSGAASTKTYGSLALDSKYAFTFVNEGGLLNTSGGAARFNMNLGDATNPASLFYRMGAVGSPELSLTNMTYKVAADNATIGVDTYGLLLLAPSMQLDFSTNVGFDANPTSGNGFISGQASDKQLLYVGAKGTVKNFLFQVSPGGVAYGGADQNTPRLQNRSEGLNIAVQADFNPDFKLELGNTSVKKVTFSDWAIFPGAYNGIDISDVTFDAIKAGQGAGGLCWGGDNASSPWCQAAPVTKTTDNQFSFKRQVKLDPQEDGLAILIRNANFQTYARKIALADGINRDWGLIASLSNAYSNIYLYPGDGTGIKSDVVFMAQTPEPDAGITNPLSRIQDQFKRGTHFMIADTTSNLAFGLYNARLLFAAKDLTLSLNKTSGTSIDQAQEGINWRTTTGLRLQVMASLGGGDFPNLTVPVRIGNININIEADKSRFTLIPSGLSSSPTGVGSAALGFSAYLNLTSFAGGALDALAEKGTTNSQGTGVGVDNTNDGTFISFAEPGNPEVDFRLAAITGPVSVTNGSIEILDLSNATDAAVKGNCTTSCIRMQSTVNLGVAANPTLNKAFEIGRVEVGGSNIMRVAIPSATLYSSITLRP